MTEFITRVNSNASKYRIIFDTDNYKFYKIVQEICRLCIDSANYNRHTDKADKE